MKRFIVLMSVLVLCVSAAYADTVWILCQPDSYVNVRSSPNKKQEASGFMECGWEAETNGKSENGYLYLDLPNEDGYGWVNKGYIVCSKPIVRTINTYICSNGRVACWCYIGGKRRCWLKPGDDITVYAISATWSVTNKGFIKTEFLGVDYDILDRTLARGFSDNESDGLYYETD